LIRVTDDTHIALQKAAKKSGVTVGKYVSQLLTAAWVIEEMQSKIGQAAAAAIATEPGKEAAS